MISTDTRPRDARYVTTQRTTGSILLRYAPRLLWGQRRRTVSELFDFQCEVGRWQRETFGSAVQCTPTLISHLAHEVIELAESRAPEEAADCLILLLGIADVSGYDLLEEARAKMEVNRRREWGVPDPSWVVEHRREKP